MHVYFSFTAVVVDFMQLNIITFHLCICGYLGTVFRLCKTSYSKILSSVKGIVSVFWLFQSLWNVKGIWLLTLNALNCFKDYERCIHISYHILDFVQQKKSKFTMEQPYMLHIIYCQYHACWCLCDLRSEAISRHGIDQIDQNILSLASEELYYFVIFQWDESTAAETLVS